MATKTVTYFTVEGRDQFPFDMLRYDQAFPATTDDAVAIAAAAPYRSLKRARVPFSIKLVTFSQVTPDRWASFDWLVSEQHTERQ